MSKSSPRDQKRIDDQIEMMDRRRKMQLDALGFDPELVEVAEEAYQNLLAKEAKVRDKVGRQFYDSPLGHRSFLLGFQAGRAHKINTPKIPGAV